MATQEQLYQLEKNAGALKLALKAGQMLGKIPGAAIESGSAVVRPALNVAGKVLGGAGKAVGYGIDKVVNPALMGAGKAAIKGTAGAGAFGAGVAGQVGKSVGKGVIAPAARKVGQVFKKHPVQATLGSVAGYYGGKDILSRNANRSFTTGPGSNQGYNYLKQRFDKVGNEMKKEAGIIDYGKKVFQHGGTLPSLLGLGAMAAIPYVAAPSLSGLGDSMKRSLFPLDSRINAEEEIAKKQMGIVAAHRMDQQLGQQDAMGRSFQDMPVMESNLQYYVDNDPIIQDFTNQDPSRIEDLRETMNTVYKFAPDIATNRQAAHSILRESAMSPDGGLNYNTIKLIADAQKSISQGR